jgi:hypothetical protein
MSRASFAGYIAPREHRLIFEIEPDDDAGEDVDEATLRIDVSPLLLGCQHGPGETCRACERTTEP